MEFRVCIFPVLLICLVQISTSLPTPKDSSVAKSDELIVNSEEPFVQKIQDKPPTEALHQNEITIPGRVRCEYAGDEPTEDEDCQRHCIPKGYTYGLCFNNVCSCA